MHVIMHLKENFVLAIVKLILNFFSAVSTLSLISSIVPILKTKNLFLQLSISDGEMLSTPKMVTFTAKSLQ